MLALNKGWRLEATAMPSVCCYATRIAIPHHRCSREFDGCWICDNDPVALTIPVVKERKPCNAGRRCSPYELSWILVRLLAAIRDSRGGVRHARDGRAS